MLRERPPDKRSRRSSSPLTRPRLWLVTSAALVLSTLWSGCYHLVMPVRTDRMPDALVALAVSPRRTIRLVNGYTDEAHVWFRTEGIHHIGADLREWTDRLLVELQVELDARGITVLIVQPEYAGRPGPATLMMRITGMRGPDPTGAGGADIDMELSSQDSSYLKRHSSKPHASTFSEALYSLKVSIIEDPGFRQWVMRSASESTTHDSRPSAKIAIGPVVSLPPASTD